MTPMAVVRVAGQLALRFRKPPVSDHPLTNKPQAQLTLCWLGSAQRGISTSAHLHNRSA
jgi:hypothetical protein